MSEIENPLRDAIAGAIRDHDVLLFMKGSPEQPQCGFSARTVQALRAIGASPIHHGFTLGCDARLSTPSHAAQVAIAWRACWGESKTCSMLLWFFGFRQALRKLPTV